MKADILSVVLTTVALAYLSDRMNKWMNEMCKYKCVWLDNILQYVIVLVHLGCYDKIPQTEEFINNSNLLLLFLDAGSSKSGC